MLMRITSVLNRGRGPDGVSLGAVAAAQEGIEKDIASLERVLPHDGPMVEELERSTAELRELGARLEALDEKMARPAGDARESVVPRPAPALDASMAESARAASGTAAATTASVATPPPTAARMPDPVPSATPREHTPCAQSAAREHIDRLLEQAVAMDEGLRELHNEVRRQMLRIDELDDAVGEAIAEFSTLESSLARQYAHRARFHDRREQGPADDTDQQAHLAMLEDILSEELAALDAFAREGSFDAELHRLRRELATGIERQVTGACLVSIQAAAAALRDAAIEEADLAEARDDIAGSGAALAHAIWLGCEEFLREAMLAREDALATLHSLLDTVHISVKSLQDELSGLVRQNKYLEGQLEDFQLGALDPAVDDEPGGTLSPFRERGPQTAREHWIASIEAALKRVKLHQEQREQRRHVNAASLGQLQYTLEESREEQASMAEAMREWRADHHRLIAELAETQGRLALLETGAEGEHAAHLEATRQMLESASQSINLWRTRAGEALAPGTTADSIADEPPATSLAVND